MNQIDVAADQLLAAILNGKKILVCGNGGSAADSQHFAAEIVGRFKKDRKALPALALTVDSSIISAVGNDYSFDSVYSRQVEGLANIGDVLIGISTSGNSLNVINAIKSAKHIGLTTIGLMGKEGGSLIKESDISVLVPSQITARIQEMHIFILHYWAEYIETNYFGDVK
jgi:D-sedoheptulose 7-phosphate isomerase